MDDATLKRWTQNVDKSLARAAEDIVRIDKKVTRSSYTERPTYSLAAFTPGSVLFADSSGRPFQDNTNFFWDDTLNRLSVGAYGFQATSNGSKLGGALVQNPLVTGTSFARAWFGHNAIWDNGATLWDVDAIGANDVTGMLVSNGGAIDWIIHVSTGNTSRTFTHANFIAGSKMSLSTTGVLVTQGAITSVSGNIAASSGQVTTNGASAGFLFNDRATATQWQWYGSTSARLFNGAADIIRLTTTGIVDFVGSARAITMNGTQVLIDRQTGWNAPTTGGGALLRGTFDTGATLPTTNRTLAALIADLRTHGIIGT